MNKAPVKFILGEAGTAKTTYLIKIVEAMKNKRIACLAFTHSAVNNMRAKTTVKNVVFKTIHSFLGIIPKNSHCEFSQSLTASGYIRNKRCCENALAFDVIIIDEFTLIPLDIFNLLLSENVNRVEKFVIAGDLLQLPPPDSYEFVNEELFKEDSFASVETDILTAIKIAKHLSQTAYNSDYFKNSDKMILKKNFRNGSNVMRILNDALANKFDIIKDTKDLNNVVKLINDGYIVISSKYYLLKKINKKFKSSSDSLPSPIGLIAISSRDANASSNQEFYHEVPERGAFYLTENIDADFSNGDIVKILKINDEDIEIIKEDAKAIKLKPSSEGVYPIMPLNFYTVHKAQGKTFEKIIVVLDDMFELSMLYTAITRAKEDVKFICFNQEKAFKEIREQNKAFNLLKQIVYV